MPFYSVPSDASGASSAGRGDAEERFLARVVSVDEAIFSHLKKASVKFPERVCLEMVAIVHELTLQDVSELYCVKAFNTYLADLTEGFKALTEPVAVSPGHLEGFAARAAELLAVNLSDDLRVRWLAGRELTLADYGVLLDKLDHLRFLRFWKRTTDRCYTRFSMPNDAESADLESLKDSVARVEGVLRFFSLIRVLFYSFQIAGIEESSDEALAVVRLFSKLFTLENMDLILLAACAFPNDTFIRDTRREADARARQDLRVALERATDVESVAAAEATA